MFRSIALSILTAGLVAQSPQNLPKALTTHLKQLEETWHILDKHGEAIWPGWTTFRNVPFRFKYPNNVEMLVGHPDPTDGFVFEGDLKIGGKAVLLDRRREIPLKLDGQLDCGGGVLPFGKTNPVQTVDYALYFPMEIPPEDLRAAPRELRELSEGTILTHVHELFHCFQREKREWQFGNLDFNPDANYAIWSEVEGLALEKAYLEPENAKAKAYLLDFLAARRLKRKSMTTLEGNQESEDECMEGTAVYAKARALECLRSGHTPKIQPSDDLHYDGFRKSSEFLDEKLRLLRLDQKDSLQSSSKSYHYGCFQSLLMTRLMPEWQKGFMESKRMLDEQLHLMLNTTPETLDKRAQELPQRYPMAEITARHTAAIQKRDAAYSQVTARKGRSYIVNFKPIQGDMNPKGRGEHFRMGLIQIYPKGIEKMKIQEVSLEGRETPMINDQLFYVKWVDAESKKSGFSVSGKNEAPGIWTDATFTCGGFTLKAPRIQVKEDAHRVKVSVLAKIKEEGGQK